MNMHTLFGSVPAIDEMALGVRNWIPPVPKTTPLGPIPPKKP